MNKPSARSTAAQTKMLTVCKRCGKPNANGYQYCTACHTAHRNARKTPSRIVKVSSVVEVLSEPMVDRMWAQDRLLRIGPGHQQRDEVTI